MNKKYLTNIMLNHKKYSDEEREILLQLQSALLEWNIAKESFQFVSDPKLIDLIICKEDEAKSKYLYFLSLAKSYNITVDPSMMLEQLNAAGKW